jgi:acetyl esterase/lipase
MTTAALTRHEIEVEDVEYLRHGSRPLLARLGKPRGEGPFPLIIDLHGGAWCAKDRTSDAGTDIANYRNAGGRVELHLYEGMGEAFITNNPTSPAALSAIEKMIEFVHRELRG